jgi:hypothetical protein
VLIAAVEGIRTSPAGTGGRGTYPHCGAAVMAKCGDETTSTTAPHAFIAEGAVALRVSAAD